MSAADILPSSVKAIGKVFVPVARFFPNGIDPDAYCLTLHGNCLEPLVYENDEAIVSPALPLEAGRFVILWFVEAPRNPLVKRLVIPPIANPRTSGIGVDGAVPVVIVEMLNPAKFLAIPMDKLSAIHAIAGFMKPEEYRGLRRAKRRVSARAENLLGQPS